MKRIFLVCACLAAVLMMASFALAAGAGITQNQSGSAFQSQRGCGLNTQNYVSGGTQRYGVGLKASETSGGWFGSSGSSAQGFVNGNQGTTINGSQFSFKPQSQNGCYTNHQGASVNTW